MINYELMFILVLWMINEWTLLATHQGLWPAELEQPDLEGSADSAGYSHDLENTQKNSGETQTCFYQSFATSTL